MPFLTSLFTSHAPASDYDYMVLANRIPGPIHGGPFP